MSLTKEQAKQIYAEAFFSKLAEHGISPQSDEDRQGLLNLSSHTRKLAQAYNARSAGSKADAIKTANVFFDRHFNGDAALDELIGAHSKAAEYGKDGKKKKDDKKKKDSGSY